jgi:hypothetical protein
VAIQQLPAMQFVWSTVRANAHLPTSH